MNTWLKHTGLWLVLGVLSACGSNNTAPPPPPPATPTISIFALETNGNFGGQIRPCLQFLAAPSENMQLLSVNITHAIGNSFGNFDVNLGGALVIPSERLALQPPNTCYLKISGQYRFTFTVTRPNSPTQFTVPSTYNQQ
jgi:hypothetical protein